MLPSTLQYGSRCRHSLKPSYGVNYKRESKLVRCVHACAGTADAMQRYSAIAADFKTRYGEPAQMFARAPGRVNIIGEHVDYEGCGAA